MKLEVITPDNLSINSKCYPSNFINRTHNENINNNIKNNKNDKKERYTQQDLRKNRR